MRCDERSQDEHCRQRNQRTAPDSFSNATKREPHQIERRGRAALSTQPPNPLNHAVAASTQDLVDGAVDRFRRPGERERLERHLAVLRLELACRVEDV